MQHATGMSDVLKWVGFSTAALAIIDEAGLRVATFSGDVSRERGILPSCCL